MRSSLARTIYIGLLCVIATAAYALPSYAKNIDEMMTFTEWQTLVKEGVARVPELKPLWKTREENPNRTELHDVYLGGGIFRGLVHWYHQQLQNHTVEQVRHMSVPGITTLLIQKDADFDLYAPKSLEGFLTKLLAPPGCDCWDILPVEFAAASARAGGTTLEKTRVNPEEIVDPLGGLEDYYHGKLVFKLATDEDMQATAETLKDNSRTALALRFIRFTNDLPELTPTPESLNAVHKSPELDERLHPLSPRNYWISKALGKLHGKSATKIVDSLITLKQHGLLTK